MKKNIEEQLVIQVSINPTMSEEDIQTLEAELKDIKGVDTVRFSDKDEELDQLIEDYGETFEQYEGDKNPLYDVFIIELSDNTQIDSITGKISKMDGVVEATYGTGAVNTMVHLFASLRYGGLIFIAALIFLSIFLIRNTIKMTIRNQKR